MGVVQTQHRLSWSAINNNEPDSLLNNSRWNDLPTIDNSLNNVLLLTAYLDFPFILTMWTFSRHTSKAFQRPSNRGDHYQCSPLKSATSTRVAELLPYLARKQEPIKIVLHEIDLANTDHQSYIAISYAWNGQKADRPVKCGIHVVHLPLRPGCT